MDMLRQSLANTHENYFRKVNFQTMMAAGLNSLRIVVTTPALRQTFGGLGDRAKRNQFLGTIDAEIAKLQKVGDAKDSLDILDDLVVANRSTVDLPEQVLVAEFADGAFGALDPFSSIIWPTDWEEFQKTTKGEFSGVGIQIQVDDSGNLKVVSPLEDSPAYRAGIKPDYIISHINGKSAHWISTNQAVKLITGPPGTTVRLTIKDTKANSRDYILTRETIKVASVKGWLHKPGGGWDYFIDSEQQIGYVRLTNFSKTTANDLRDALAQMNDHGVRGIILDLRYNPGGLLNSATEIVDRFVANKLDDKGRAMKIVSTRPERPDSIHKESGIYPQLPPAEKIKTPLVVLVNQYSASASEIVSGALKDFHRGLIVGDRTFGKGSVQMLYPLTQVLGEETKAVLKLTTSHYYLPNGKCIHREEDSKEWGVEPDVSIELTPEQMRTALAARQESDILRDAGDNAPKPEQVQPVKAKKDPLQSDPQLSAALLLLRLQVAGT